MDPLIFKFSEPIYNKTLYLDKDGVLNTAINREGKISSPRNVKEIILKKDLDDIENFYKKKNSI